MYTVRNWLIIGIFAVALLVPPLCAHSNGLPDSLDLGTLANLYEKVKFDHAKHILLVKECADCHHHTTGTLSQNPNCVKCHKNSGATASVACKSCHLAQPFSAEALRKKNKTAYHQDIPGLKGAYHLACSGCHQKMGGPTGCEDCHPRNKTGDALYSAGAYAPAPAGGEKKHGGH